MSPCNSVAGLYFESTYEVISVTMATHKVPKFFNFSDSMEKIYPVELNIFKENAIYGLQKILLDNFSRNFYI